MNAPENFLILSGAQFMSIIKKYEFIYTYKII